MPSSSELRRIVLTPDAVVAESEPEVLAPWYRAEGGGVGDPRAVDFDGDGTDEVLEQHEASHGGSTVTTLVVRRVEPPQLRELYAREIGYDNLMMASDQPVEWESDVAIAPVPGGVGHQLVVTTSWIEGTPSADDLSPGEHVFRLVDGVFGEVAPATSP